MQAMEQICISKHMCMKFFPCFEVRNTPPQVCKSISESSHIYVCVHVSVCVCVYYISQGNQTSQLDLLDRKTKILL